MIPTAGANAIIGAGTAHPIMAAALPASATGPGCALRPDHTGMYSGDCPEYTGYGQHQHQNSHARADGNASSRQGP